MEHKHQQKEEQDHAEVLGSCNDSPGGDHNVDGYSGPRARMVLDQRGTDLSERVSAREGIHKLGLMERIVRILLASGMAAAIVISLLLLPFAFVWFFIYIGLSKAYTAFTHSKEQ